MDGHGYLATPTRRPTVLAGVVAVHIVGLGGLLLLAPQVERVVDTILTAKSYPIPDDPKPSPPDRKVVSKTIPEIVPIRPVKPYVDPLLTPDPDQNVRVSSDETPAALGGSSEGSVMIADPPKEPVTIAPVMVGGNAQPPYPADLQRMEIAGRVIVRVLVSADGRPLRIEAVETDHARFFEATQRWGMKHWRFKPATRDGVPIEAWRVMTVRFTLNT